MQFLNSLIGLTIGWLILASLGYAEPYQSTKEILKTDRTIIGEKIVYPGGGEAEIRSMVVVIAPGEDTKWHKHPVPLYAYILSGTLTVDYGDKGKRTYVTGDAFMEAMDQWHRGQNDGNEPVRILAVFMGGNNQPHAVSKEGK